MATEDNKPNFTTNQNRAITESGNIIVSAGAGSGKTTVMIERIINKLKNGVIGKDGLRRNVSLDQMLIVTFTRSSAADMRAKLTEKLYKLKREKEYAAIAAAALDDLPTCNIGTLHSYCQRLIKTYFYAAGIDPSAAVCEESEAAAIRLGAVSDAVERAWTDGDPYFLAMYDMLGSRRSDDGVISVVADILEFALSMPDPIAYLTDETPDSVYLQKLNDIIAVRRAELNSRITRLRSDLAAAGMTKQLNALSEFGDYMDGAISEITKTTHRTALDITDELNERFKTLKKDCGKHRTFVCEAQNAAAVDSFGYSYALRRTALDALHRYAERKKTLGKMDYSDLEHGAYGVLCDDNCLAEILNNIRYVFIDEFQDVNPLQSAIADKFKSGVPSLGRSGAEMFVVGDVKQSIYGFRRCSPEHFKRAIDSPDYLHIPLADNFRSQQNVIDFINEVFDGVMTEDFGGVDYKDKDQRLVCGRKSKKVDSGDAGCAKFIAVSADYGIDTFGDTVIDHAAAQSADSKEKCKSGESGYSVVTDAAAAAAVDCEAKLVADLIVDVLANGAAPQMGGIAVLLRSVNSPFCAALCNELDRRSIKYDLGKKSAANTFPEVVALVDILRCADNRYDDVALYTAMRSALGGFSDAELLEIARSGDEVLRANAVPPVSGIDGKYAFWQKVTAYNGKLADRIAAFISRREDIIRFALDHDSADVLGYITATTDYFRHVYETGGNAAAVDALIGYAESRACDVHAFLDNYDNSTPELTLPGGGDAVVISTIHSSKGLEYDTVIVADTAKQFNEKDMYGRVLVSENGVFVKVPNESERTLDKSAPWIVENTLYPDRLRAEELRLLYVALTRAKKTLIVCGKDKKLKQAEPRECTRLIQFMSNVLPTSPDITPREPGGGLPDEYGIDELIVSAIKNRHEFLAEYNAARERNRLPIKTCVTSVAHRAAEQDDYTRTAPAITRDEIGECGTNAGGEKTDSEAAMLRGTAYHRAMELIDFAAPNIEEVRELCENFELVDENEILTAASRMNELVRGCKFYAKERDFIVDLAAKQALGAEAADGNVLVQGVIDLLVVDADGNATIVDYKTGDPRSLDNVAYRTQLRLYAAAVERTTPYKVKRTMLYSFAAGRFLE